MLIKIFRSRIASKHIDTVEECSEEFRTFLLTSISVDEASKTQSIASVFLDIIEDLHDDIKSKYKNKLKMLAEIDRQIAASRTAIDPIETIEDFPDETVFSKKYKKIIKSLADDIFEYKLDSKTAKILVSFVFNVSSKRLESAFSTGVVFAGFGGTELLPVMISVIVDGMDDGVFRYWQDDSADLSGDNSPVAYIKPFGQKDIAFLFIEGVIAKYLQFLDTVVSTVLDEKSRSLVDDYVSDPDEKIVENERQRRDNRVIVEGLMEGFEEYRREELVSPLLDVITHLPKEEMATLAEAIVELTSLRRRMESHMDSVGGPIDVALISKGDGFIWIKRKHYFNLETNQDFIYRKNARIRGDGHERDDLDRP
jgi:hypothetical protein